jgi:hypothetical protein
LRFIVLVTLSSFHLCALLLHPRYLFIQLFTFLIPCFKFTSPSLGGLNLWTESFASAVKFCLHVDLLIFQVHILEFQLLPWDSRAPFSYSSGIAIVSVLSRSFWSNTRKPRYPDRKINQNPSFFVRFISLLIWRLGRAVCTLSDLSNGSNSFCRREAENHCYFFFAFYLKILFLDLEYFLKARMAATSFLFPMVQSASLDGKGEWRKVRGKLGTILNPSYRELDSIYTHFGKSLQ